MQRLFKLVRKEADDDFKPLLFKRLMKWVHRSINDHSEALKTLYEEKFKTLNQFKTLNDWNAIQESLPANSGYVWLQINENKSYLYMAIMTLNQQR